jgi:hypothetical protein
MKWINIHKPTSAFWSKVALACTAVSSFLGGYGLVSNTPFFVWAGGILGPLGVVIPIFMSNGEDANKPKN